MTIRCDFRAINGEPKSCEPSREATLCAGAALTLGGLLLLIAP